MTKTSGADRGVHADCIASGLLAALAVTINVNTVLNDAYHCGAMAL
ncbi:hypothetical protein [Smaragdicoccus niigatensis]|nr:hypothetical protein [Smaragdicoccus niigatensis]